MGNFSPAASVLMLLLHFFVKYVCVVLLHKEAALSFRQVSTWNVLLDVNKKL